MMKVWVVMSNDYPDAVFATEEAAEAHIVRQKKAINQPRIYWRSYEFTVNQ